MKITLACLAAILTWGMGAPAWGDDTKHDQLKKEREKMIHLLEEYAETGEFPFGKDGSPVLSGKDPHFHPGKPFVHRILGSNGNLCALAYLMAKSGHEDLVKTLAKNDNHFCVGIDRNPAVDKWILLSGLTLEECIDIQRPAPPPVAGKMDEEMNKQRLARLLRRVVANLKKNSGKSLRIAVERFRAATAPDRS